MCTECTNQNKVVTEFQIEQQLTDYIQSLDFQRTACMEIIGFMCDQKKDPNSEIFKQYDAEFRKANMEFNLARNQISNTIPEEYRGDGFKWQLNYATSTITINKV